MPKICPRCKEKKPLSDYHKNKAKSNGRHSYCKACNAARQKEYKVHSKPQAVANQRRYALKKFFGLTEEQYDELLQKQGGCCAICKRPATQFQKRLAVDHDHHTLAIRGLLCIHCNRVIVGRLRGPEGSLLLANASEYLKQETGFYAPANRPKKRRRRKSVRT